MIEERDDLPVDMICPESAIGSGRRFSGQKRRSLVQVLKLVYRSDT